MRKLIFILLAFLAVITYIRALDKPEVLVNPDTSEISVEIVH